MINLNKWFEMKSKGIPIAAITAYDAQTSGFVSKAEIDMILVGDSLGMVVLGHETTIPVTIEDIVHHTKAVAKGCSDIPIVADMPFLSCGVDIKETIKNAGNLILAGAHAVKLEGGSRLFEHIKALIDNGIPVVSHIGMEPQSVLKTSGYKLAGRDSKEAAQILEDAKMLDNLGVCAIVLECIPEKLGKEITQKVKAPTIGIGAGRATDGQILVINDMLGMTQYKTKPPKFLKKFDHLDAKIVNALKQYVSEVKKGVFPQSDNVYLPMEDLKQSFNQEIKIVKNKQDLIALKIYEGSQSIGFVPTMGALHEGHLSLIKAAKKECETVVASIFVNPTQFGVNEDFDAYPRELATDVEKLKSAGCDVVFIPDREYLYPKGDSTEILVKNTLTQELCAQSRPGHFEGVTRVVLKLLNIVMPQKAFFGLKDYQQFLVISQMVKDLFLDVEIIGCPTVREADGLAMSSRNKMLTSKGRKKALLIHKTLEAAKAMIISGESTTTVIEKFMHDSLSADLAIEPIYTKVLNSCTLIRELKVPLSALLAIAAKIDNVRLIDNILVEMK